MSFHRMFRPVSRHMHRFAPRSFRGWYAAAARRGLLALTVAVLIVLASGPYFAASAVPPRQDDANAALFARLEAIAEGKQAVIERWYTDSLDTLSALAVQDTLLADLFAAPGAGDDAQRAITDRLTTFAGQHDSFATLFAYDVNGTIIAASDAALSGTSAADTGFYMAGLEVAQVHKLIVTGPGAYRLVATVPVVDGTGEPVGVLAADLDLAILAAIMQPSPAMQDTVDAYLISAPDRGLLTPSRFLPLVGGDQVVSVGSDRAASAQSGSEVYFNANGTRVAGVYRWLPQAVGLIVEAPLDGQVVVQAATSTPPPAVSPTPVDAAPSATPEAPPAVPTETPAAPPADGADTANSDGAPAQAATPFVASATPEGFPTATLAELTVAEQVFEGGRMVWVEPVNLIWVLVASDDNPNQGDWFCYADAFVDGDTETDPDIVPPDDRYQPARGFGQVWRTVAGVREQLGWALTPEFGYVSPYTYLPGGTFDNGQYAPGPGEHQLNTLYGERLSFFEQEVRGDCMGGTWQLRP